MNDPVLTQQHGAIMEIALNRPEAYNALNLDLMKMLGGILSSAATDQAIKGIFITGKGKAFCSGGDQNGSASKPKTLGLCCTNLHQNFTCRSLKFVGWKNLWLPL